MPEHKIPHDGEHAVLDLAHPFRRQAIIGAQLDAPVCPSTAVCYARRYEDEGTVAVKARAKQTRRLDPYGDDILGWIEETPDMTLDELSARLRDIHQARAPKSTIDDWLRSRNISFKKNRTRQ